MVGFDPNRIEKGLTNSQCGICGAISGAFTRCIAQPLDVLKIRFQLQVEPTFHINTGEHTTGKYTGVLQATKLVLREEGITALWKGHVPAQALSVVYGYFQFAFFEAFTKAAYSITPRCMDVRWKPATHFLCGGLSGCAAAVMAQPLDVIRTRLVAQGEPKVYTGVIQAAKIMYTREGPKVFFKGLVPSLLQIFPYAGLQFGSYSLLKSIWDYVFDIKVHYSLEPPREMKIGSRNREFEKHDPYKPADVIESLICGGVSGTISKAVILPFDIVKKRLQVQGFEEARMHFGKVQHFTGVRDCFRTILLEEGIMGLFKGLAPSTIKAAVTVSIMFCTYEQCLNAVRQLIHDDTDESVSDISSSSASKHASL